jgi:hypothetical protein
MEDVIAHPGKRGGVCHIYGEVAYPPVTGRILGCSGPWASRPADDM